MGLNTLLPMLAEVLHYLPRVASCFSYIYNFKEAYRGANGKMVVNPTSRADK